MQKQSTYGVIGAGSFGTAMANLLALNVKVLLYSRNPDLVQQINDTREHLGVAIHPNIVACSDLELVAKECPVIFPIVPSDQFRALMREIGPYLNPSHILIHGTKGFDLHAPFEIDPDFSSILPEYVHTMSQVILQESSVRRVGCLSGPNLASEIMEGQPTATVVASKYQEVIDIGKNVLSSPLFRVYGNQDLLGAELAGALKNIIAIGSGILRGRKLGKNIQAILISRGLVEMIRFGKAFGSSANAFFGTAGVGDLIATATSKRSRNFTFGYRLGQGEPVAHIQETMPELAEGVRTLQIAHHLSQKIRLHSPITSTLYKIVFSGMDIEKAIRYLLTYPYDVDVDFL